MAEYENSGASTSKDKGKKQKKESIVWNFFELKEGEKKVSGRHVLCTLCNRSFSRGSSQKYSMPTTNMLVHLKNYHPTELKKKEEEKRREEAEQEEIPGTSAQKNKEKYSGKVRNIEYMHVKCGKCKQKITKGEKETKDLLNKMDMHKCAKK